MSKTPVLVLLVRLALLDRLELLKLKIRSLFGPQGSPGMNDFYNQPKYGGAKNDQLDRAHGLNQRNRPYHKGIKCENRRVSRRLACCTI